MSRDAAYNGRHQRLLMPVLLLPQNAWDQQSTDEHGCNHKQLLLSAAIQGLVAFCQGVMDNTGHSLTLQELQELRQQQPAGLWTCGTWQLPAWLP